MKKIILTPWLILIVAFITYWFTKPPSILWIDSGTMIGASASLGIPNPPGFPLYMVVTHLFNLLIPFASYLTRLELFTILFAMPLLYLIYQIIVLIIQNDFFFFHEGKGKDVLTEKSRRAHLSAFFATFALAFSYQFWSQSENTESYIFTYFFVALFTYLLLKLAVKKRILFASRNGQMPENTSPKGVPAGTPPLKYAVEAYGKAVFTTFLAIAVLYGIASGANPTVAALIPGVLFVLFLNRQYFNESKLFILAIIFMSLVGLVYAYLPIRASAFPFINWGNPQTPSLFIGHLRGAGLNIYEPEGGSINGFTGSPMVFVQSISYFFLQWILQFTPILFPLILIGMYIVYKKNKYLFWFLMSVPLVELFYSAIYYSGNQESWFILAWEFFAIFLGIGFYTIITRFNLKGRRLLLAMGCCLIPFFTYIYPLNRHNHYYSSDYQYNLYTPLKKDAILLGTGDFFNALSHYTHEADAYRADVTPVTVNTFYVNRWYRDGLKKAAPQMVVSDKLEDIIKYKQFSEFNDAMNTFIADNIDKHPIYVVHLALRASALAATNGGQLRLDSRFKFIPHGLSLEIVKASQSADVNMEAFNYRFRSPLGKPPFYLERNYKAAFKNILNDYLYGYEFLGDWYADHSNYQKAIEYYNKAFNVSFENTELWAHLGEYYARLKDYNASYQYLQKASLLDSKNYFIHFNLGLTLTNLGKIEAAKNEFEAVKLTAPHGDPVSTEAQSMLDRLNSQTQVSQLAVETSTWQEVKDKDHNIDIRIAPTFTQEKSSPLGPVVLVDKGLGQQGLAVLIIGKKLTPGQTIEEYLKNVPLKMEGVLLDTQNITIPLGPGVVQVYGMPQGGSSLRYIVRKDDWVWVFKVSPGNSAKIQVFQKMLATLKPYEAN